MWCKEFQRVPEIFPDIPQRIRRRDWHFHQRRSTFLGIICLGSTVTYHLNKQFHDQKYRNKNFDSLDYYTYWILIIIELFLNIEITKTNIIGFRFAYNCSMWLPNTYPKSYISPIRPKGVISMTKVINMNRSYNAR